MGAEYLFCVKSIVTFAPKFYGYIISILPSVICPQNCKFSNKNFTHIPFRLGKQQLIKDLWIYGPNTQIAKYIVGGTQKPLYLYWCPIFSWIFLWNYFSMHIKGEGMTQFDIFHVFVENSVNSEFCFFWALLKPAKIWNLSKNAHVWAA